MTRTIGLLAGVFVVGLGAAGCQQVVTARIEPTPVCDFNALMASPPPASGAPAPAQVPAAPAALTEMPLNSVNITDVGITNKIMVQSANARRNPTGTVEVWTRVVNCTDFPLQIEGRTHFLDEGQAPVEEVSSWIRVFLSPRSYGVYKESSIDVARVRYYYVEIREGR
jgi:hypothetical protein